PYISPLSLHDALPICPIDGSQAHGTGFATGIDIAVLQLPALQAAASITYGHYFGMRRRVVGGSYPVIPLSHYLPMPHNHTAKRTDRKSTRLNSSHVKI